MKLGFIGLGKMGAQMVGRLLEGGHEIVVLDTNQAAVTEATTHGAKAATDRGDLVSQLGANPLVWLMIPSDAVENEIAALIDLMPHGGAIVDGGNSDYRQTKRRAALAAERGVQLVDVGTSGGIMGHSEGFSLMVGGDRDTAYTLQPAFESLAQPSGWAYFGPAGAGHYLKMVHNAIEYGIMESYAEGYRLIKEGGEFPDVNLSQLANTWQHGSIISSRLGAVIGEALRGNPTLDGIDGFVAESGEARWAVESAGAAGISLPVVQSALDVRMASQEGQTHFGTKLLAAMRNVFGGHKVNK